MKARTSLGRAQTTLKTAVSIEGVGLHSGHPVRAHFRPAPPDHGLVFLRRDYPETPIPALLKSAATFDYATTLSAGGVSIGTVEHVLSAAVGEGLDNCRIEIEGPEVPILDGSALPFVRLFHAAGFARQAAFVRPLALTEQVEVSRGDRYVRFSPDGPGLTITYEIDFPHPAVGRQELTFTVRPEEYSSRIAPARTFGFAREVEKLRARGLARGGSLQNAVVLDENGIVSGPLRFRDEFVRHKILDLLGDLALLGHPLHGHIHARKAGHALHIEFARELARQGDLAVPLRPLARQGDLAVPLRPLVRQGDLAVPLRPLVRQGDLPVPLKPPASSLDRQGTEAASPRREERRRRTANV